MIVRKKKLNNWLGEDWVFTEYSEDDPAVADVWGRCDLARRTIHVKQKADNESGNISTVIHEVMHRCMEAHQGKDENEIGELRVEWAANCMTEFLRKMGVDLSPLIGG